ncbi:MAG: ATP synthase F1 subunit epsilon [Candidatus Handelsmanbacteria bacterium RIFCSPLOWO2_12_FULL_64_10]|uniref:ATP synthase epsilon chain n=1 Tax=Handelsmanbacteria sp. (strain RIFCSPLOWO2_12_FULL_64_10) TaxID=1817868 RepID=A0A1F6C5D6_HANXR|nr:MAG: ATP synthase F1 subunit epsilon [Candidatus Handelsmanbacteria bacterium RIFCSPLOWO2_12_FULL_64_10]
MATFNLEIVTPQRLFYRGEVEGLRAPGVMGSFGVLARHIPFLTALTVGEVILQEPGGVRRRVSTSGGFVEVLKAGVTVLAETAEFAEEIDRGRAEQSRQRARERLRQRSAEIDRARAEAALARAVNRLRVVQRM